ncbi:hypothetical protein BJX99DRAFT_217434 [Aspergillus californicus]
MAPTILIVGATGNTGRSVTETLPKLLKSTKSLADHRIIALTRSAESPVAQKLAQIPGVEVIEQNWVEITAAWLQEHQVVRVFIASHNEPKQFAEESTFHVAALRAGVQYVVRISTTAANVTPDCDAYYPRSHWAIEAMLDSPEFGKLQWTSLQPNVFTSFFLAPAVQFVQEYRKTGKQETLRLMASEDAAVGVIDADEVGVFAAHLLATEDTTTHNKKRYVLNGAGDITGRQVVDIIEKHTGTKVKDVRYKDLSFVESLIQPGQSRNVIMSISHAAVTAWEGKCSAATTSKEVLQIAPPKRAPVDVLEELLQD